MSGSIKPSEIEGTKTRKIQLLSIPSTVQSKSNWREALLKSEASVVPTASAPTSIEAHEIANTI